MIDTQVEISGLKFEQRVFTDGFVDPAGPGSCTSNCCKHGVYLDPVERDRILAHGDMVEKYLDETQPKDRSKWFDNTIEPDLDFPSGVCVSTEVHNDKCVFLDKKGRCSLQVAEEREGIGRFSLKPFYCVLFPIVKFDGVYEYDDFCSGESPCCTASPESKRKMVEVCAVELQHAIGDVKYRELMEYFSASFSDGKGQGPSENV